MQSIHQRPRVKVEAAERESSLLALMMALGAAVMVAATLLLFFVLTLPAGLGS